MNQHSTQNRVHSRGSEKQTNKQTKEKEKWNLETQKERKVGNRRFIRLKRVFPENGIVGRRNLRLKALGVALLFEYPSFIYTVSLSLTLYRIHRRNANPVPFSSIFIPQALYILFIHSLSLNKLIPSLSSSLLILFVSLFI